MRDRENGEYTNQHLAAFAFPVYRLYKPDKAEIAAIKATSWLHAEQLARERGKHILKCCPCRSFRTAVRPQIGACLPENKSAR